jgi:hypothetical protein
LAKLPLPNAVPAAVPYVLLLLLLLLLLIVASHAAVLAVAIRLLPWPPSSLGFSCRRHLAAAVIIAERCSLPPCCKCCFPLY